MTVPSLDYLDRVIRKPRATTPEDPSVRAVSYKPTGAMREEARRGLEWRKEHGRGGTAIGVARARDISNGRSLPLDTVKRMVSYFARHEIDKQGQGWSPGEDGYPSAGRIAWALWGGDAGRSWANKIADAAEERYNPDQPRDENGRWSSAGGGFEADDPTMVDLVSGMADDARSSSDLFIPDDAPNDQALKARAASAIEARLGDVSTDELLATMGDSKHLDDIKRVYIDGEPWEEVYPDQARFIENPDQYQLRLGVNDSGIVTPYLYRSSTATIHPLGDIYPSVDDIDYHDAERAIRTSIVSRHIQQWAQTSNDHNARSLLAQEAVQREFGIDDAAGWDIEPAQLRAEMDSLRPTLLPVQQKIARAMYEETQSVLARAGVTELSIVRGMSLESTDQLAQFVDKANPILMRPMSSWSTETQVAATFAGGGDAAILLSTKVPASRVLSMPGTGFGCLSEGEVVLLGGTMEADVVTGNEIWDVVEGRNLDLRYNPDQPRDENGRWSSAPTGSIKGDALAVVSAQLKEEALVVTVDNAHLVGDQLTDAQQLKFLTAHTLNSRLQDVSTDDLVASTNNRNERACLALARNTTDIYGAMDIYTEGTMAGTGPSQKLRSFVEQSGREFQYGVVLVGGRAQMVMYHARGGDGTLYDPFTTARTGQLSPALSRFDPSVGPAQVHTGEMGVQIVRLSSISQHVQAWAETSNDHNPHSLLAQETAKSVFRLQNTAGWDIESVIQESMDESAPRVTPVQTRILQEMHGRTQEVLARNGITEVSVARGMAVRDADEVPMMGKLENGRYPSEVQMRPLSSWTTDLRVAEDFAVRSDGYPVVMLSRVPAGQILSFAGTGYGCDGESEVVLLGGIMPTLVEAYDV